MEAAGEPAEWCDINEHPEALTEIGADIELVRLRLHVREPDGQGAVGAAAFAALWRRTPGQRKLGRFLGLPGVGAAATLLYDAFARLPYAWNRLRHPWQSAPAARRISAGPPVYPLEDAGGAGSGCMAESLNSPEDRPMGRAPA